MKVSEYENEMKESQALEATVHLSGCHEPSYHNSDKKVKFLAWITVDEEDVNSLKFMEMVHRGGNNKDGNVIGPLNLSIK